MEYTYKGMWFYREKLDDDVGAVHDEFSGVTLRELQDMLEEMEHRGARLLRIDAFREDDPETLGANYGK